MRLGFSAIALLCLTAGCASGGLSSAGWEVGRQWGCDPADVESEYTETYGGEAAPGVLEPQVGWSACQLLSLTGPPDEVTRVESESGATYHLYYRSEGDTRIVTLRPEVAGMWMVSAVVW